jgi:hypothetical protein
MNAAVSKERTRALTFIDLLPLFELGVALAPGPAFISTLEDSRRLGRAWFHGTYLLSPCTNSQARRR